MNTPNVPKTRALDAWSPASLDSIIETCVAELRTHSPAALARGPAAFRKRVLRLADRALSPDDHAPGRPRKPAIDAGHALHRQQRREMAMRTRKRLDWLVIARVVDPEFESITDPVYRRVWLGTIRYSVHARDKVETPPATLILTP